MRTMRLKFIGLAVSILLSTSIYAAACALGETPCNTTYPGGNGSCWGGNCDCAYPPPSNCCDGNGVSHAVTGCKADAISNAVCTWVNCGY